MVAASWLKLVVVGLAFQPNARPEPSENAPRAPALQVLFWFARNDPIRTFSYRVYDPRKHQTRPDVEQWVRLVHEKYPSYEAYMRTIHLASAPGKTEEAQVVGAVSRELAVVAAYYYNLDVAASLAQPSGFGASHRALRPLPPMFPSPGSGARPNPSYLAPSASPFPYPYVRPHP
jgi:hypothetical protein